MAGQTKFIDFSIHGRIFLYESKSGVRFVKSGFFDSRDVIRKASIGNFFRLKGYLVSCKSVLKTTKKKKI